jgi:hypothetical protein
VRPEAALAVGLIGALHGDPPTSFARSRETLGPDCARANRIQKAPIQLRSCRSDPNTRLRWRRSDRKNDRNPLHSRSLDREPNPRPGGARVKI